MSSHSSSKRSNPPTNDNLNSQDLSESQSDPDNFPDPNDPNYQGTNTDSYGDGVNNYDYPFDYSDDDETIESLREQQIQAIHEMEFEKADKLQQRIAALTDRQSDDIIVQHISILTERCSRIAKEYTRRRRAALKIQHQNEIRVRRAMTDEFIDKQNKQVEQLRALEDSLFEQFKALMDRPITKYEDMNNRAIQAGMRGDFKAASDLRDEAKEVQIKKLEKRKSKFEEIYKKQINGLLDKQRQELSELTEKLNQNISLVEKQRKTMIENESVSFRRKMLREYSLITNKVKINQYDPVKARQNASRSPSKSPSRSPSKQNSTAGSSRAPDEEELPSVPPDMKKVVLKELASTFDDILIKYGISKGDDTKALSMLDRPSSKASSVASRGRGGRPF